MTPTCGPGADATGRARCSGSVSKDAGCRRSQNVRRGGSFGRVSAGRAVILLVDPKPAATMTLAAGWKETRRSGVPGVQIVFLERPSR